MAQLTTKSLQEKHIKALNSRTGRSMADNFRGLRYTPLKVHNVHMRVYIDASFAIYDDLTSLLGYLVLLCDDTDRCYVLDFESKKSRRIISSIIREELYAFTDAFNISHTLLMNFRNALGRTGHVVYVYRPQTGI